MADDDTTKAAALYMIQRGLIASPMEGARLTGRSRQIVAHWMKQYPNARAEYLAKAWQRALKTRVGVDTKRQ